MDNNRTGYFKVWRELFEKPIWLKSTSNQRSIFFAILYLANWQENKWTWCGEEYICMPGEFITSHEKLKKAAGRGITIDHVRTALNTFQKQGYITIKSPKNKRGGIKVIVNNWGVYQNEENPNKTRLNPDIKPEQIPTNKEYKNNIENKKQNFIKPTIEEISEYCLRRNNNINPEQFYNYYESIGWLIGGKKKMKNWQAAIRTWEQNQQRFNNKTAEEKGEAFDYSNTPYRAF